MKLLKLRYCMTLGMVLSVLTTMVAFGEGTPPPAQVLSVKTSALWLQPDGTMLPAASALLGQSEQKSQQSVGEMDDQTVPAPASASSDTPKKRFVADLYLSDEGYDLPNLLVELQTKNIRLDEKSVRLLLKKGNELTAMTLAPLQFDANSYSFLLPVDNAAIVQGDTVQVYFEGTPTGGDSRITAQVATNRETELTAHNMIFVNGYAISKQSGALNNVQVATGLSGMTKNDTVYIIYSANDTQKELVRVVLQGGAVLGFAIANEDGVYSVQYDRNTQYYINELTRKPVLAKQELLNIFNVLSFSFVNAPDEALWLQQQYWFAQSKTIEIKK